MTAQLKILAAVIGVSLFLYIIELVRKRRLREEYAWFWLLTGLMIVLLSVWYDLVARIGQYLGGILPSSVLFFFGLLSLLLICLHLSIKLSTLTDQVKRLSQELAIMRSGEIYGDNPKKG